MVILVVCCLSAHFLGRPRIIALRGYHCQKSMPSKAVKKSAASKRRAVIQESPPKWPPLQPLVPSSDLSLETLLEDQIVVIRDLLTSSLCKNYVSFLSSLPLITTPGQPKKDEALRVNDRFQVDDARFAEALWRNTALQALVAGSVNNRMEEERPQSDEFRRLWGGEVLGLNPRIRIYRYGKGHFFGQHCECTLFFRCRLDLRAIVPVPSTGRK